MADKILYKKVSYEIVGCFYNVYNTLGPGHKEDIYCKALEIEFTKRDILFSSQKRIKIRYDGKEVGIYQPDFIIDDKIIIEVKSVWVMPKVFDKQLYYYLKTSGYKLGYLVNFGSDQIEIKRRIM